jgi:hypothetical protein
MPPHGGADASIDYFSMLFVDIVLNVEKKKLLTQRFAEIHTSCPHILLHKPPTTD